MDQNGLMHAQQRVSMMEVENVKLREKVMASNEEIFSLNAIVATMEAEAKFNLDQEMAKKQSELNFRTRELQELGRNYQKVMKELNTLRQQTVNSKPEPNTERKEDPSASTTRTKEIIEVIEQTAESHPSQSAVKDNTKTGSSNWPNDISWPTSIPRNNIQDNNSSEQLNAPQLSFGNKNSPKDVHDSSLLGGSIDRAAQMNHRLLVLNLLNNQFQYLLTKLLNNQTQLREMMEQTDLCKILNSNVNAKGINETLYLLTRQASSGAHSAIKMRESSQFWSRLLQDTSNPQEENDNLVTMSFSVLIMTISSQLHHCISVTTQMQICDFQPLLHMLVQFEARLVETVQFLLLANAHNRTKILTTDTQSLQQPATATLAAQQDSFELMHALEVLQAGLRLIRTAESLLDFHLDSSHDTDFGQVVARHKQSASSERRAAMDLSSKFDQAAAAGGPANSSAARAPEKRSVVNRVPAHLKNLHTPNVSTGMKTSVWGDNKDMDELSLSTAEASMNGIACQWFGGFIAVLNDVLRILLVCSAFYRSSTDGCVSGVETVASETMLLAVSMGCEISTTLGFNQIDNLIHPIQKLLCRIPVSADESPIGQLTPTCLLMLDRRFVRCRLTRIRILQLVELWVAVPCLFAELISKHRQHKRVQQSQSAELPVASKAAKRNTGGARQGNHKNDEEEREERTAADVNGTGSESQQHTTGGSCEICLFFRNLIGQLIDDGLVPELQLNDALELEHQLQVVHLLTVILSRYGNIFVRLLLGLDPPADLAALAIPTIVSQQQEDANETSTFADVTVGAAPAAIMESSNHAHRNSTSSDDGRKRKAGVSSSTPLNLVHHNATRSDTKVRDGGSISNTTVVGTTSTRPTNSSMTRVPVDNDALINNHSEQKGKEARAVSQKYTGRLLWSSLSGHCRRRTSKLDSTANYNSSSAATSSNSNSTGKKRKTPTSTGSAGSANLSRQQRQQHYHPDVLVRADYDYDSILHLTNDEIATSNRSLLCALVNYWISLIRRLDKFSVLHSSLSSSSPFSPSLKLLMLLVHRLSLLISACLDYLTPQDCDALLIDTADSFHEYIYRWNNSYWHEALKIPDTLFHFLESTAHT